ncbi:ATP phosphoribosyltransferase [Candidatus Falkowbacteria bacterium]|nr:ATP phosphoribosyltransferase [Candidatus Falkowbacteria bacterium]
MENTVKIAIQKKGHLRGESVRFLNSLGIIFAQSEKTLSTVCADGNIEIIFLRDDDIPKYVNSGLVDFGILGKDVIEEKTETINVIKKLDFSKCRIVIAVPQNSGLKDIKQLQNKILATSYPNLLQKYLKQNNVFCQIVYLSGSVEIAPRLKLADAICDITQTGKSLVENNLTAIDTILESEAVLIESPFDNPNKQILLNKLKKYGNRLP